MEKQASDHTYNLLPGLLLSKDAQIALHANLDCRLHSLPGCTNADIAMCNLRFSLV